MFAQQQQPNSLNLICGPVVRLGQEPQSGEQQLWEDRLRSLQHCISELLLENQRLRMHLHSTPL
jgi:hypothetical protein